ncbi:MAG TPA: hypothetical protein VLM78_03090 [Anaerolineales bacterium]|nr:hypothetical protein [Anaerolineales bacterium]
MLRAARRARENAVQREKMMLRRILKNHYVIAGLIVFPILFVVGLWTDFSWGEAALGAAALTAIGIAVYWWKETF